MAEQGLDNQKGEIAIIGMAGRFPRAKNVDHFWQNLLAGVDSVSLFSEEELRDAGVDSALLSQPNYIKSRAIIGDVDMFDASFFGFTPREAEITDPQHRLFLECAWEVLESAGYSSESLDGSVAVFAGSSISPYILNLYSRPEVAHSVGTLRAMLGNDKDFLPTWVSYKLNLRGPSVNVQSACSTSLVAVHLACQSLLDYQSDLALAGGVSIHSPEKAGYLYQEGSIMSPDGHCRAFDARAGGSGAGNGVGILALKRLEEALEDGDNVHAVIKGCAINNDGSLRVGFTAPSIEGQAEVIAAALADAGIPVESIGYVEAHGSGTALGDPIEVAALTQAFGAIAGRKKSIALGSVKTNIGHTGATAGAAGLIKTVLALKHGIIPPTLHFEKPNPQIDFDSGPFFVNTRPMPWPVTGMPRRAGVSSFGLGGTNAHVILEEPPSIQPRESARPWQAIMLSAKTETALESLTDNLAKYLEEHTELNIADVGFTLQVGRRAFSHRRMLVCHSLDDAVKVIKSRDPRRLRSAVAESTNRSIAFMFPGLGDHYVNMAYELYKTEPKFREQFDRCCETLKPLLETDLRDVVYLDPESETPVMTGVQRQQIDFRKLVSSNHTSPAEYKLNQTCFAQPALFAIEYSLATLLMDWGIRPQAMIGYSIGEYVAACLAGVFSPEDALLMIARRSQLIQQLPKGAMLAAAMSEKDISPLLNASLSIAGINGPALCVVAGPHEQLQELEHRLIEAKVACRLLPTIHAFHSPMMNPAASQLAELAKSIELRSPRIPYLSNLTGKWITAEEATDPDYWTRHLCMPVRFSEGLNNLLNSDDYILLEVGPGQMLTSLVLQNTGAGSNRAVTALPTMRNSADQQDDAAFLLDTLGRLWLAGVDVNWSSFHMGEHRRRVALPTYPFERNRYYLSGQPAPAGLTDFRHQKARDGINIYLRSWRRSLLPWSVAPNNSEPETNWLVFSDADHFSESLVEQLRSTGPVICVSPGDRFERIGSQFYYLNPRQLENYIALTQDVKAFLKPPIHVLHLWTITYSRSTLDTDFYMKFQEIGFHSLISLAKAMSERFPDDTVNLTIVSNNIHDVSGEEFVCPEKSMLFSVVDILSQRFHNINPRLIDITFPQPGSAREQAIISQIVAEASNNAGEKLVAYRGDNRWITEFETLDRRMMDGHEASLPRGSLYFLLGDMPEVLAGLGHYISLEAQGKVVVIGDSKLHSGERQADWGDVRIRQADFNCPDTVLKVMDEARHEFGSPDAIFYIAGDSAESETEPPFKPADVNLIYNLARALPNEHNHRYILVSPGRSSPMSAFLEAFVQSRNNIQPGRWMSVSWEGIALLEEPGRWLNRLFSLPRCAHLTISAEPGASAVLQAGNGHNSPPNRVTPFLAPRTQMERTIAEVWHRVLGITGIGVHDDFFHCGGNSLLGVQLTAELREIFQVDIPVHALFQAPTIAELVDVIEEALLAEIEALGDDASPPSGAET